MVEHRVTNHDNLKKIMTPGVPEQVVINYISMAYSVAQFWL